LFHGFRRLRYGRRTGCGGVNSRTPLQDRWGRLYLYLIVHDADSGPVAFQLRCSRLSRPDRGRCLHAGEDVVESHVDGEESRTDSCLLCPQTQKAGVSRRDDLDVELLPENLKFAARLFYGIIDGFAFDFNSFHCSMYLYAGCLLMYTCWPMLMMLLNSQ
jgi:hypothetical protein